MYNLCRILFETIHEFHQESIPLGPMYAAVLSKFGLEQFNLAIEILVGAGKVGRVGSLQVICRCFGGGFESNNDVAVRRELIRNGFQVPINDSIARTHPSVRLVVTPANVKG